MLGDLPPPPVPPEVDGAELPWMPLYGDRLFRSDFDAEATDAEFRAALNLWWAAWRSRPAASLPNNDTILCKSAGLGRDLAAWGKVKSQAMHGFRLASDGRLYHTYLVSEVLRAWEHRARATSKRLRDRERLEHWRAKRREKPARSDPRNGGETRFTACDETRFVAGIQNITEHNTNTHVPSECEPERKPSRKARANAATPDPEFEHFWGIFPRHVARADALRAWQQARTNGVDPESMIRGVQRFQFSPDPKYCPYPASWIRGRRWEDEPAREAPKPVQADQRVLIAGREQPLVDFRDAPL